MKISILAIGFGIVGVSTLLFACNGTGGSSQVPAGKGPEMMPVPDIGHVAVYKGTPTSSISLENSAPGDNARPQSVIFVHGTPGSASAWDSYLQNVPGGMKYAAIDRPGFGASTPRKVMPLMGDQAAALEPLLPEGEGKAILVGHSLGGPIIAKAAVQFPERVGGIVIVAGSLDPALEKILWIQHVGRWWPFSKLIPSSLDHSNREIFALEKELEILEEELAELRIPVIIIHGTKDKLVPYENVAFMQGAMANADLEIITLEGQNHFLPWNSKPVIDDAIMRLSKSMRE